MDVAKTQRIGLLPIDGFALMSFASVAEPLRAANLLAGRVLYDVVTIGAGGAEVASSGPAHVTARAGLGTDLALDFLFVIAGGRPEGFADRRVLGWIGRMARKGVVIGGVSGGPVILVKAGVMRGFRMTVHWEHAPALLEAHPDLILERSLFVTDRGRVTCGGGTAALDMMLALIERHHGAIFSRRISDWFLHPEIRESSSAQRMALPERIGTTNAAVVIAVAAMEEHIAVPVTLARLAGAAGVSPRHLNRLFLSATGTSAMRYYRDRRLEAADNLLGSSVLSITEIAQATGFASSSHFASAYRDRYGALPSAARRATGPARADPRGRAR